MKPDYSNPINFDRLINTVRVAGGFDFLLIERAPPTCAASARRLVEHAALIKRETGAMVVWVIDTATLSPALLDAADFVIEVQKKNARRCRPGARSNFRNKKDLTC